MALLTVLGLLTVITLTTITFMFVVRGETQASRNYLYTMMVKDLADAGGRIAMANVRSDSLGPDGVFDSGDERKGYDSLQDSWGYGFSSVLSQTGGITSNFSCLGRLNTTDWRTERPAPANDDRVALLISEDEMEGINRPFRMGVDEDPPGAMWDPAYPGRMGVDDDGDGYADYDDPEVKAAMRATAEGGLPYIAGNDDDEDGLMDEDGPDDNFGPGFTIGQGIDADGDSVGVYDENSKLDLNCVGNIAGLGSDFPHVYSQGVSTFEIDPAFLLYDRLALYPDSDIKEYGVVSALVQSPVDAAVRAAQITAYRNGGTVTTSGDVLPGRPDYDDNGNSINLDMQAGDPEDPRLYKPYVIIDDQGNKDHREWMGNMGDGKDNDNDGLIDEADEYPLELDGIDNDGDGEVDEIGEGIDDYGEFRVNLPLGSSGGPSDDRPFGTPEEFRLIGPYGENQKDIIFYLGQRNAFVPSELTGKLKEQFASRVLTAYQLLQEYITTYSMSFMTIAGKGYADDLLNPNYASNLIAAAARKDMKYLYSLQIDNDGDWDPHEDDHNGNKRPDGNWDGRPEYASKEYSVKGEYNDDRDNDGDGLKDDKTREGQNRRKILLSGSSRPMSLWNVYGSDDGDVDKDGVSGYDPEWHINEDPIGDANSDGRPGIGTDNSAYLDILGLIGDNMVEFWDGDGALANDDGDSAADFQDPEVKKAMKDPSNDGIDNNWNSPIWLYDGIDNDHDGRVDERAVDDREGKDEGVDEPGEWYIAAFDDDEDGRDDEDPSEFQLIVNLIDSVDMPVPAPGDYGKDQGERTGVPQSPDFPTVSDLIPVYSLFDVRDPLTDVKREGNWDILEHIGNILKDPDNGEVFKFWESVPKITYVGGEAVRINEVMGCPMIRLWVGDDEIKPATTSDMSGDADNMPNWTDPFNGVPMDDVWQLYSAPGDPLSGKFWMVHNWATVKDSDSGLYIPHPITGQIHEDEPEELMISIEDVPSGSYEMNYIVYPPEIEGRFQIPGANGTKTGLTAPPGDPFAGVILTKDPANPAEWLATRIPADSSVNGLFTRVIRIGHPVVPDSDGKIEMYVYIGEDEHGDPIQVSGTFGFAGIELYDADQQYVELINVAEGRRPMVLNPCISGKMESGWRLNQKWIGMQQQPDEFLYLSGVVYSDDMSPTGNDTSENQGENLSLITRYAPTTEGMTKIHDTLKTNYKLLEDSPFDDDDVEDDTVTPPAQAEETLQRNMFLGVYAVKGATDETSRNLNVFNKELLFSSQPEDSEALVLGGVAETVLTLEAPKNRPEQDKVEDIVWGTMDEIRVTADTRGRNYRGFQAGEIRGPFEAAHDRREYTIEGEKEIRYIPAKRFTRIPARDALAVDNIVKSDVLEQAKPRTFSFPAIGGSNDYAWVLPGAWWYGKDDLDEVPAWNWKCDPEDTTEGYFEPADKVGASTGTFCFDLTPYISPGAEIGAVRNYLNFRIFGSEPTTEGFDSGRTIGRVGLRLNPTEVGVSKQVVDCGVLHHGETLVSGLDTKSICYVRKDRYLLILEIGNTDEMGNRISNCSFKYLEVSLADYGDPHDTKAKRPLIAGTPSRHNVSCFYNPNHPEHWDGMMPTRGRIGFIAMGEDGRAPTLDETGKLADQVTTSHVVEVPGLINVNTAKRASLICLPWASPPASRDDVGADEFMRMYDWNCLMSRLVTNAREERTNLSWEDRATQDRQEAGVDDDGDGFIDEGPYATVGDLTRAIGAIRWMPLGVHKQPKGIDWSRYVFRRGDKLLPGDLILDEMECLFGSAGGVSRTSSTAWMQFHIARLEKEIFSRVSNLITVQSNVFEIITKAGVIARDDQGDTYTLATKVKRLVAEKR